MIPHYLLFREDRGEVHTERYEIANQVTLIRSYRCSTSTTETSRIVNARPQEVRVFTFVESAGATSINAS